MSETVRPRYQAVKKTGAATRRVLVFMLDEKPSMASSSSPR